MNRYFVTLTRKTSGLPVDVYDDSIAAVEAVKGRGAGDADWCRVYLRGGNVLEVAEGRGKLLPMVGVHAAPQYGKDA